MTFADSKISDLDSTGKMNSRFKIDPWNTKSALTDGIWRHVRFSLGKEWEERTPRDLFIALSLAIRDRLLVRILDTEKRYRRAKAKRLYYLSMEFLIGRSLGINLSNLGVLDVVREAMKEVGSNLEDILEEERDAALGNGGLGRLAACFLDSLATMDMPGYGYGLHYQFGLFKQEIENGHQKEQPDNWLSDMNPWLIERRDEACLVPIYGRVVPGRDARGHYNPMWMGWRFVVGVPHDMPITGYGCNTVNYLRLFAAYPPSEFDIETFNSGDYLQAVSDKIAVEKISKILYPSDTITSGKELRLIQEYFLVSCSLRDIFRRYLKDHDDFEAFPDKVSVHLNDTHPALTVVEMMRLLVDEYALNWDDAWEITRSTVAYTNHTLLPEALEKWSVHLIGTVLPRHLEIIFEINSRFLSMLAGRWPGDVKRLKRMSLIEEGSEKQVRMANLAIVGSHSINGVSALHTRLLKERVFKDFHQLWPGRFNNKTNGITLRRWLLKANPLLADLISSAIGTEWIIDGRKLKALEGLADDTSFQTDFLTVKQENKEKLSGWILETLGVKVNPETLFDIHAKRIHEYKRQLLNVMNIVHEYLAIVEDGWMPPVPKTYIFAGKAAPGYWEAKQIIKLINNVAMVIQEDRRVREMLNVVFLPDYRVSLAEKIIPTADLSEQISTAGKEASGTGNMKFALNGALTIGTLDGANIEILEEVGPENMYIFGLQSHEIDSMRKNGSYDPVRHFEKHLPLRRVLEALRGNLFCLGEPGLFQWIYSKLLDGGDPYFHLADFISYNRTQQLASRDFRNRFDWAKRAILNVARMGRFSGDRTVAEYAREVWDLKAVKD